MLTDLVEVTISVRPAPLELVDLNGRVWAVSRSVQRALVRPRRSRAVSRWRSTFVAYGLGRFVHGRFEWTDAGREVRTILRAGFVGC